MLNSTSRGEVVDPEVCQGFTTDEVKVDPQYQSDQSSRTRQNPSKVPAPPGPGLYRPADDYLQQIRRPKSLKNGE